MRAPSSKHNIGNYVAYTRYAALLCFLVISGFPERSYAQPTAECDSTKLTSVSGTILDKSLDSCLYQKGLMAYTEGKYQQASYYFSEATKQNPGMAAAWYAWGTALYYQNQDKAAIRKWQQCLKQDPKYAPAYEALAAVALQKSKTRRARSYAQRAISIDPSRANAHYNLAMTYHPQRRAGLYLQHLQYAIECNPTFEEALLAIAHYHYQAGNRQKALDYLNQLLTHQAYHAEALMLRASIFQQSRQMDCACTDWLKALQAGSRQAAELWQRHCP